MAKIIELGTIILTNIQLRSILLFKNGNEIVADLCYDVLRDDGSIYEEAKHTTISIPEEVNDVVKLQWEIAIANAYKMEGLV